ACTSTNDIFVLSNWAKDSNADGKILMLADGSAEFVKKIGLDIDLSARGLGIRSKRYSMIVEDGVVKSLNVEDAPPNHDKSSAATLCSLAGPASAARPTRAAAGYAGGADLGLTDGAPDAGATSNVRFPGRGPEPDSKTLPRSAPAPLLRRNLIPIYVDRSRRGDHS